MKRAIVLLGLIVVSGCAFALEDTETNRAKEVDRYLLVSPPREMLGDLVQKNSANLPLEKRDAYRRLMTKYLDIEALTKAMREAMVKNFTAGEMKAMADFYGSPEGKSVMKKFGAYMADLTPSLQAEMLKAQAKANRELNGAGETH